MFIVKKLILAGSLCVVVLAVSRFGYMLDYRLSDSGLPLITVANASQANTKLDKLKDKYEKAKDMKNKTWKLYKKNKAIAKEHYSKSKKTSISRYKTDKVLDQFSLRAPD